MRTVIDPGKERRSINFIDNICFSHVAGRDLYLSLMVQNGNSEMRLADGRDDEVSTGKQPLIVWINGAGWRGVDKNLMAAEMQFLAEAGYAVACIDYRGTMQGGRWPDQLVDVKTAVRFLRAHAGKYCLDAEHVGVIGRSAGGHLATWMAMNTDGFDTGEWADQSSKVQAAVNMFGPTVLPLATAKTRQDIAKPGFRWKDISESHEGMLLGLTSAMSEEETLRIENAATPSNFINPGMCPLQILHGDKDPLVPLSISETLYDTIAEAGFADRTELYVLKNGGHGTREFFQPMTKKVISGFFDKYLK